MLNRNFILLWQGQLVSQIGSQLFSIAMLFWVKQTTGSATLMGLIMMVSMLPVVFMGPIGGTIADRYSRRKIIVRSDISAGLAVLSLVAIFVLGGESVEIIVFGLFVVSIVIGLTGSFLRPSISASIPDLVPTEKVAAANSLNQSSLQLSMLVGLGIGGVLFRLFGAQLLFLIDGITYLFSAGSESFITIPQKIPDKNDSIRDAFIEFKNDLYGGFSYVWEKTGMRNVFFGLGVLNFFAHPIILLLPFYVEDYLKVRPDWYGYLMAAYGTGALLGFIAAGWIKTTARLRGAFMLASLFGQAFGGMMLGLVFFPFASITLIFLIGVLNGYFNVIFTTILQMSTSSEIRGRVFGLSNTITIGLSPLALALGGVVADLTGQNIPLIYVSCAGVIIIATAILSFSKETRSYLTYEYITNR